MTDKDGPPEMPSDDLQVIIEQFNASHWRAMELEFHGTRLFLSKDAGASPDWASKASASAPGPQALAVSPSLVSTLPSGGTVTDSGLSIGEGQVIVKATSLGTFYRSPKPGTPPFTQIGDEVDTKTELCLIEVMKLFTTLRAGVKGRLVNILVEDGVMVEHDQPLFIIDTNG